MTTAVSIVGGSGFSGIELIRLLAREPRFEITSVLSDRLRGQPLGECVREVGRARSLTVLPLSEALAAANDADIVCLATPAEASAELAPRLIAAGKRVVDLSGAFRLPDPEVFAATYGFVHPAPELLGEAYYGLPQVPGAAGPMAIEEARLVANPGCYATATILPLAALLADDLIEPEGIFVDGKSGITGAGRKVAEKFMFTEVSENLSPYRVANHQHAPEMELVLSRVSKQPVRLTFVPHLIPIRRGLIATSYGRLKPKITEADLESSLRRAYAGKPSPFDSPVTEVTSVEQVNTQAVWGTPTARMGVRADEMRRSFVSICAIDNLMKGAASQALENLLRIAAPAPESR